MWNTFFVHKPFLLEGFMYFYRELYLQAKIDI